MRSVWPMRRLIDEAYCILIGQHFNHWPRSKRVFAEPRKGLCILIFNFRDGFQISKLQQVKDSIVDCDFELHIHKQIIISLCPSPLTQSHTVFENVR